MKPNLFLVGAAKAGTTSLYAYLSQHPDILFSSRKEPYYFSYPYLTFPHEGPGDRQAVKCISNLSEYEALFDKWNGEKVVGEASVDYLYYKQAAIDIKDYAPEAKILITLRNPADRAFSAYKHLRRDTREELSFEESLALEEIRIRDNYSFIWHFKAMGLYFDQVKMYYEIFGKDRVKIIVLEELLQKPQHIMHEVLEFLEVDPDYPMLLHKRYNVSNPPMVKWLNRFMFTGDSSLSFLKKFKGMLPRTVRKRIKELVKNKNAKTIHMKASTRNDLMDYYAEDINRLSLLMGKDLTIWR
jgi:hypothetical protein